MVKVDFEGKAKLGGDPRLESKGFVSENFASCNDAVGIGSQEMKHPQVLLALRGAFLNF